MKNYLWFYEFENIFHKYSGINQSLIIKYGQLAKRDRGVIDEDDLKGYHFNIDQDLEDLYQMATLETKREKDMSKSYSNLFDRGSDFNSSLYSALL